MFFCIGLPLLHHSFSLACDVAFSLLTAHGNRERSSRCLLQYFSLTSYKQSRRNWTYLCTPAADKAIAVERSPQFPPNVRVKTKAYTLMHHVSLYRPSALPAHYSLAWMSRLPQETLTKQRNTQQPTHFRRNQKTKRGDKTQICVTLVVFVLVFFSSNFQSWGRNITAAVPPRKLWPRNRHLCHPELPVQ